MEGAYNLNSQPSHPLRSVSRQSPTCRYYKKTGHTIDECFKLKKKKELEESSKWEKSVFQPSVHVSTSSSAEATPTPTPPPAPSTPQSVPDSRYKPNEEILVRFGGGETYKVLGVGTVVATLRSPTSETTIQLDNVLFLPSSVHNLLSVRALGAAGVAVSFPAAGRVVLTSDDVPIGEGYTRNNLFYLQLHHGSSAAPSIKPTACPASTTTSSYLWHRRFGHLNMQALSTLHRQQLVTGLHLSSTSIPPCISCYRGKQTRQPFGVSHSRTTAPLQLIHSDIAGPLSYGATIGGARYLLTFIDDYSRHITVYLLRHRSEALSCFKAYVTRVHNMHSPHTIKTFRFDGALEFTSKAFTSFLTAHGIARHLSTPYTPEQNGVAKQELAAFPLFAARADPGLFIAPPHSPYRPTAASFFMLLVYVDDLIILSSSSSSLLASFKHALSSRFKLRDLGPLSYYLGFHITRDRTSRTLHLHQSKFITSILDTYSFSPLNPAATPMDTKFQPPVTSSPHSSSFPYTSFVGSIMNAMVGTRPDLAYSAGVLARHLHDWSTPHVSAAKRIARYLKGTTSLGLLLGGIPDTLELHGWSDASWGPEGELRRSTGGLELRALSSGPGGSEGGREGGREGGGTGGHRISHKLPNSAYCLLLPVMVSHTGATPALSPLPSQQHLPLLSKRSDENAPPLPSPHSFTLPSPYTHSLPSSHTTALCFLPGH
ncbi:unnamed protein product [Closterium sp. NIES-53]